MLIRWILMAVAAGVLGLALGGCNESPGLSASFDYVMPERFVVPELRAAEDQGEYEVYIDGLS